MPPLNIDASFHQISNALFTFIMAIPIIIPTTLIIADEIYKTFIESLSEADLLKYLL